MITTELSKAKEALENNKIIAIPTETVYGLAGNAYQETAIKKIFQLKKRPYNNPLIVHIKSVFYLNNVATEIPKKAIQLAEIFWPGPLTLVLKKQPRIPAIVTGGKDTVAVRVPNHPLTLTLLELLDFPLAAPSANPFGSISPTSSTHVSNYFPGELEVILEGGLCKNGIESTIIGFENNRAILYRHGAITVEDIENVIGKIDSKINNNLEPEAPGMFSRHYAPKTSTYLTNNVEELIKSFAGKKIGLLLIEKNIVNKKISHQEVLTKNGNLNEAAKNLYAAMHRLDQSGLDAIIAEKFPDIGLGKTINDRLQRAVKK
mgnify:CR=1 FL=1